MLVLKIRYVFKLEGVICLFGLEAACAFAPVLKSVGVSINFVSGSIGLITALASEPMSVFIFKIKLHSGSYDCFKAALANVLVLGL